MMVFVSPLMLLIALAIWLTAPGAVSAVRRVEYRLPEVHFQDAKRTGIQPAAMHLAGATHPSHKFRDPAPVGQRSVGSYVVCRVAGQGVTVNP